MDINSILWISFIEIIRKKLSFYGFYYLSLPSLLRILATRISCWPDISHAGSIVAILRTDEKCKVARLFVTPRRPRSSLIEEWWINVHAFDLAGGALSNRVPLSWTISFAVPTHIHTHIPVSRSSLSLFLFCILCACCRQERHVVRNAFTPCDCQRTSSSFCRLLAYRFLS